MKNLTKTIIALAITSVSVSTLAMPDPGLTLRIAQLEHQVARLDRVDANHADNIRDNNQITSSNAQGVHNNNQWLGQLQERVDHQAGDVFANGEDIGTQRHMIQSNSDDIAGQQTEINSNRQSVAALGSQVQENANHALDNKADNQRQQTEINHNREVSSANALRLAQDEAEQANAVANANHRAAHAEQVAQDDRALIEENSNKIAQNSQDIQELRKDFEDMAKKVDGAYAESAAFAGLVSPYGVGNFAITAAVGHHGQADAVAFGVGERFTENFTAKLGGAYDTATESMSAYAGVGYEF